jgi:hypothetical protein
VLVKICDVGIGEHSTGHLAIYPNPVHDQLFFSSPLAAVQVFDITGKLVSAAAANDADKLDVSALAAGVYFLKADLSGEPVYFRFVKE